MTVTGPLKIWLSRDFYGPPEKVLLGALLFGGVEALQLRLRAIGLQVPYQLLLSLPYLATIVALALAGRNASYPAALLKLYEREE